MVFLGTFTKLRVVQPVRTRSSLRSWKLSLVSQVCNDLDPVSHPQQTEAFRHRVCIVDCFPFLTPHTPDAQRGSATEVDARICFRDQ